MSDDTDGSGVAITFERLFDIRRAEKDPLKRDLQKLPGSFFRDLFSYLQEKDSMLREARLKSDMFAAVESEKIDGQLKNARTLISDIYARREAKIVELALNRAKTRSAAIDTSHLLPEEQRLYDSLVSALLSAREGLLDSVLSGQVPQSLARSAAEDAMPSLQQSSSAASGKLQVRFLENVEPFIGKELEEYGPFEANEVADLPSDVAGILIKRGQAIEVLESSAH